ncbi:MAG: AarF/UbiB family protein [Desulfuromonadales bacterium]|nr:AarF/UbiB family protein [Desulfuromonadales bacterium]MDH4024488.1 AarF/UbiB family protein [Desulfuromonadales bacterium]
MLPILRVNRNIRTIRRYRTILGVLIKYGFGHFVEQLNIDYYLELGKRLVTLDKIPKDLERLSQPQRLRLVMEELGPTFIKLGQLLSTRPDVLDKAYILEFSKLQDKVPAVSFEEINAQIQRELGYPAEELFAEFSTKPLAAASIAQVHRGKLKSGEEVVFKVRRPGIVKIVETDIDVLMGLAYLIEQHVPTMALYDPVGLVKEFRRSIMRELNFTREGRTVDRFAVNFAESETVYTPKIFWDYTGDIVLTMEYVDGIKISALEELTAQGYDLKEIARRGADAFLKQVLDFGLFHADPHPGNVFILPDQVICMLDYGMVGRLGQDLKDQLIDLLQALLNRDVNRIISQLLYSGELTDDSDMKNLRRDLHDFIEDYYDIVLQDIKVGKLLTEFIEILTHHRIHFPADFMILAKALVIMEGVGRQLDPEFNMINHMRPYVNKLVFERFSPKNISEQAGRIVQAYSSLAKNLPQDIKEFVNRLNRNQFKIDLEHRGLEKLVTDLDRSSNRVSFAVVIGSLIVGSSLVMQIDKGPMILGFPLLGLLGYSIAGFLGLWLAIGILRSGRL